MFIGSPKDLTSDPVAADCLSCSLLLRLKGEGGSSPFGRELPCVGFVRSAGWQGDRPGHESF